MSDKVDITIVVPVYHSVETLRPLYERTAETLKNLGRSFEILFVEDGGAEESWEELLAIKADFADSVKLIRLERNYGQNAATVCGITHAQGEAVITLDDDLQTPPEELEKLIRKAQASKCSAVYGVPSNQKTPFLRRTGSAIFKQFFSLIDGGEIGSSFRYISPDLRPILKDQPHHRYFLNQIIFWNAERIEKIEVIHHSRSEGSSGYSMFNLIELALRLVFGYTDFPLKLMSILGVGVAIVCLAIGGYLGYQKISTGSEIALGPIGTTLLILFALIVLLMSVLGIYVSRSYAKRSTRELYAIKTIV